MLLPTSPNYYLDPDVRENDGHAPEGLQKGMRLQAEADGKYWAAEAVLIRNCFRPGLFGCPFCMLDKFNI